MSGAGISVLAHGVGGRSDLPLPLWQFAYAAAFALGISFVALGILWPTARLRRAADGWAAGAGASRAALAAGAVLRVVGLALFAATLVAAWIGGGAADENLAPVAVYVAFWVGMQVLSAAVGDLWRVLSPFDTLALLGQRLRGRPSERASTATGFWASHWPAAAGLAAFLWLELAYHEPASPSALALWLTVYSAAMLAGAARWGRGWLRSGEGFAVLFRLLGSLSPFAWRAGRVRVRPPLSGLAHIDVRQGMLGVVLVVLGGTTFDGFSRTQFWVDVLGLRTGWSRTLLQTGGLALITATVTAGFLLAARWGARATGAPEDAARFARRFAPSLVPIVLGYSVAHYFSLLVFEGQSFFSLISDPLGRGWDLFGTAGDVVDYTVVSVSTIAWVQVLAIVVGHVAGVVAAHDTAVATYAKPVATRSQYALLAVMIAYAIGGLFLLLSG